MEGISRKTILLVEDQAIIAMNEKIAMEKWGYSVIVASTGEQAIEVFSKNQKIDLVLMDIDLGKGIDGIETASQILSLGLLPLVFLSSHTEPEVVARTEAITSYGYVVKQAGLTVLNASIKMAFKLFEAHGKLAAEKEHLQTTFNSIGDAVIVTDTKGCITRMNPIAETLTGWRLSDAEGLPIESVFKISNAQTHASVAVPVHKVIETGQIIGLANHTVLESKQGIMYQIADSASPIRDIKGVISGVVLVFRDVTEDYLVQSALAESERKFRSLFDNMVEGVNLHTLIYDRDGKPYDYQIIDSNPAVEGHLGLKRETIIGKTGRQAYGSPDSPYLEIFSKVAITGEATKFTTYFPIMDKYFSISVYSPAQNYFATVFEDVTKVTRQQHALAEQKQLLDSIIQSSSDAIFVKDLEGRYSLMNQAGASMFGLPADSIVGKTDFDLLDQASALEFQKTDQAVFEQNQTQERHETAVIGTKTYHFLARKVPLRNASNAICGLIGISRDITAEQTSLDNLRQSEAALRRQNDLFSSLLKVLPVGVFMVEAPSGKPLVANEAAMQMLGRGIMPSASRHNLAEVYSASIAGTNQAYPVNEMPIIMGMSGHESHIDNLAVERPDGSQRLLEIFGTPVSDQSGKIWASLVAFYDITERRQVQLELEKSQGRLAQVIEAVKDGVWDLDIATGTGYFSPTFYRILGYVDQEFPATLAQWESMIHPEDLEVFRVEITNSITSGIGFSVDYRCRSKTQAWLWINARGQTVQYSSVAKQMHMVGICNDISERKSLEIRETLNQARMHRLLAILQYSADSVQDFLDYALQQAIELTQSAIGYIYKYSETSKQFTLNTWSKDVMDSCRVLNPTTTYDLDKTGFWGEAVRQRKPIILNSFASPHPLKHGLPQGHVGLNRFMTVPVFDNNQIVGVLGLANKAADYTSEDILQASMLMEAVWKETTRMEAEFKIKQLLTEKDLILKEVHHRIKNNFQTVFSLLTLQSNQVASTEAIESLRSAALRVQSMQQLYQTLYEAHDFVIIDAHDYLSPLVDAILANFPQSKNLNIQKEIGHFQLDIKRLQPLGIIVNELLTNCMKYAFPQDLGGQIIVRFNELEGRCRLEVLDNGTGWLTQEPKAEAGHSGFGLFLIQILSEQIGGTLTMEHVSGSITIIEFPWQAS